MPMRAKSKLKTSVRRHELTLMGARGAPFYTMVKLGHARAVPNGVR